MNGNNRLFETRPHINQVQQHYIMAPLVFLDAWKVGVKMAGPRLFTAKHGYIKPMLVDDACDKWQLIPDIDAIRQYTASCSVAEGVFIGSMVSFYSGETGAAILDLFGHISHGEVANRLDLEQLHVITTLMLNHTGW